ncbi:M20/M25/M40 family metallo-hydrolase [Radiobacillus kanasensis]|uniref:M20/M25/M40 family metallo-hydrolase n=1 Tax=Radiobacillus kanasensis TaxID=2844358 RepID=UPI001E524A09|nr:M20/M25/M40 family metallo-hydrolase [Radiobacillus kanasensis]UFT97699.1 M20/M25/M40 family metallo-hydrolase [Radiobacillus kanasensis]
MWKWQSKKQLTELLCSLVQYPSITGSEAEIVLPEYVYNLLEGFPYFQKHPHHLKLHPLKDGRQLLTALVKKNSAKDTVVLLSHFDVVGVHDYGPYRNLAFHPEELTKTFHKNREELPDLVQQDLVDGEWLFGRGTMDMKSGLAVHLSILEKAMSGEFDGNLLLVTVPDEEVNSHGMITALPVLQQIKLEESLEFVACLNGEPMFSKYPGDPNNYIYTGSIGKLLPGFFCYGKETHVGEPFAGLNANLMISYLAQELELNESFIEVVGDEVTPPPVSLMQRDLKEEYSVQTPTSAVAMYNLLYLQQSVEDINQKLLNAAKQAAKGIEIHFKQKVEAFSRYSKEFSNPSFSVNVMTYKQLLEIATSRFGESEINRRHDLLVSQRSQGDRDFSTLLVQDVASLCKDLAPMIILFYSPPFYPSVSSHQDSLIECVVRDIKREAKKSYSLDIKDVEFFPGLSDLSFIGPSTNDQSMDSLMDHLPIQGKGYELPVEIMQEIGMPILNVGPLGKDPHQWTERLELNYSFGQLPSLVQTTIHSLFRHS